MSEHQGEHANHSGLGQEKAPLWIEKPKADLEAEQTSEPTVENLPKQLTRLSLVSAKQADESCQFWVGLSQTGPHNPHRLLDIPDVETLLTKAATEGIKDPGPMMLTDTRTSPPRFIYLLPDPAHTKGNTTQHAWISTLSTTLQSWAPDNIGLYFSPEIIPADQGFELLHETLKQLIMASRKTRFSLLVGKHDMNSILNSALALKSALFAEKIDLSVYH